MNPTASSTSSPGTAQKADTPATVSAAVVVNRRPSGAVQCRDPYQSPPTALPNA